MGEANSFEPIVTVTGLEGTEVDAHITPSVSKSQLEVAVSQMIANGSKAARRRRSVSWARPRRVGAGGLARPPPGGDLRLTARASDGVRVRGRRYGDRACTMSSRAPAPAPSLGQGPQSQSCTRPATACCPGRRCGSTTAGQTKDYTVTVTAVDGGKITYNYAPTT